MLDLFGSCLKFQSLLLSQTFLSVSSKFKYQSSYNHSCNQSLFKYCLTTLVAKKYHYNMVYNLEPVEISVDCFTRSLKATLKFWIAYIKPIFTMIMHWKCVPGNRCRFYFKWNIEQSFVATCFYSYLDCITGFLQNMKKTRNNLCS